MFCPKCASTATEGQRFCRQCGTNLGLIVDAIEGKRSPVDFEKVKADLKELGTSLRAGFEQAHQEFKKSQHKNQHQWRAQFGDFGSAVGNVVKTTSTEAKAAVASATTHQQEWWQHKKSRNPESRRYHLQHAMMKILSGGAGTAVWYYLLNIAANSGLLESIQRILIERLDLEHLTGLVPFLQMLWLLGLIPVAQGVGHLIAAAFATPPPQIETAPPQFITPPMPPPLPSETRNTNEIKQDFVPVYSVTEEPTVPLPQPEHERQAL